MMTCPVCATEMDQHVRHGVTIDHCPACGGVWLEKGEFDHLIAAVRLAVRLRDPSPEPVRQAARPPRPSPKPQSDPWRCRGDAPRFPAKPERDKDRGRAPRRTSGKAHRYAGRYSKKARFKDILEEIFDFD